MLYSQLFPKTKRETPRDEVTINAQLLIRGGFINKLQSGVYTFLPLGHRVHEKIKDIVRANMNEIGGQEVFMPTLQPKELWEKTGRWSDDVVDIWFKTTSADGKETGLANTHEEVITQIVGENIHSYRDLPLYIYQIQTKFRNELRAQGGLLRCREFAMKDLYSFHANEEDMRSYYEIVKGQYLAIFKNVGLDALVTEAAGGSFTKEYTHEFQVISEAGEDTIYHCENGDFSQNKEIANVKKGDKCPVCTGTILENRSIEVGNIFPLGTKYPEGLGVTFLDKDGSQKFPYVCSYGIGIGRVMATIVEVSHDDRGIIWPENVAPYRLHLVNLGTQSYDKVNEIYQQLRSSGVEVLWDDRDESAGVKLSDADLLGNPIRVILSDKTLAKGQAEVKRRSAEQVDFIPIEKLTDL